MSALMGGILADASKLTETIEFLEPAIANADRPEDDEYRADMLARLSRAHMRLMDVENAVATADRALAIAEPRRLDRVIAEAFINKGALAAAGRLREPVVLLEAAVRLAADAGDLALELRARNNLAALLGQDDGNEGMRVAREAYELATRLGVRQMSQWIMGAIAYGAVYEGLDWDAALDGLAVEVEASQSEADRARLLGVRSAILVWRGDDPAEILQEYAEWASSVSDPDFQAWQIMQPATAALVGGHPEDAIPRFREAIVMSSQNASDARFGLVLSSHWARDLETARAAVEEVEADPFAGHFKDGMYSLARAGVAALDGASDAAVAEYRAAVASFERTGARFQAALTQLDALMLLPGETAIADWADAARERFEIVNSPALLERLDEAVAERVA